MPYDTMITRANTAPPDAQDAPVLRHGKLRMQDDPGTGGAGGDAHRTRTTGQGLPDAGLRMTPLPTRRGK